MKQKEKETRPGERRSCPGRGESICKGPGAGGTQELCRGWEGPRGGLWSHVKAVSSHPEVDTEEQGCLGSNSVTSASWGLSFPTCSLGCAKHLAQMGCSRLTAGGPLCADRWEGEVMFQNPEETPARLGGRSQRGQQRTQLNPRAALGQGFRGGRCRAALPAVLGWRARGPLGWAFQSQHWRPLCAEPVIRPLGSEVSSGKGRGSPAQGSEWGSSGVPTPRPPGHEISRFVSGASVSPPVK